MQENCYEGEVCRMNDPTRTGMPPAAEGVVSKPSPFSVENTLERLRASIEGHHLSVFAQIDHSDEAKRVGLSMQEAHVLIFGSPKAGTPLMVASPLLALDLPLRALVWQDQAGEVWVSYQSTTFLAERYAIPADLSGNIAGIDALVAGVLQG
jgi:uncharacterized protein (DUF302 family)